MKVTIENQGQTKGMTGSFENYHTTLLDEFKFERRTGRFQNIKYWDVWDAGEDPIAGNGFDGFRIASGNGITLEGHGEGARILVNSNLPRGSLVKYLKGLAAHLESQDRCRESEDDVVFDADWGAPRRG